MQLDRERKMIEISLRVFTDDLELDMSLNQGRRISTTLTDEKELQSALENYANDLFVILDQANGSQVELELLGTEEEYDATWIYLQGVLPKDLELLSVDYLVLLEVYEDQTNFLKFLGSKETSTYTFSKNRRKFLIEISN